MNAPNQPPFTFFEDLAAAQKGGKPALEAELPRALSPATLKKKKDAFFLEAMAKAIFRSGFRWRVVDAKWETTTQAFHGWNVARVAFMDESEIGDLAQDTRVIRHRGKITAIRDNARFIREVAKTEGSFGKYLAAWPADDVVGLWLDLKKRGQRLGGRTGPSFLRAVGKDTFIFTGDVIRALRGVGLVEKDPTSQKAQRLVQRYFNRWHEETGRPLCQLSKILACAIV